MISAEVGITVPFYDLDPMQVVWHGNYVRYLEEARCALLDRLDYSYPRMEESGYLWPIVDLRLKYVRPARFGQALRVIATLTEYENRLRIAYRILDAASGEVLTKAETTQLAVVAATRELCLESPAVLLERVRAVLA
ncbi:acyl-CoA thioesterase [Phaeospirillum tilakii]|uniref:Acyl-CoA thioesterase n=1 Tax=Phaeospirillum tilakii TaxID=741673 RepID=A0ABW5C9T5_9PROT